MKRMHHQYYKQSSFFFVLLLSQVIIIFHLFVVSQLIWKGLIFFFPFTIHELPTEIGALYVSVLWKYNLFPEP